LNRAAANWRKIFLKFTDTGLHNIGQTTSTGVQGDLMNNERWGWRCMLQLQETENWTKPAATTSKEKAIQVSDYVLISMREVASHNWSTPDPRM
jgi:hypothetical protein